MIDKASKEWVSSEQGAFHNKRFVCHGATSEIKNKESDFTVDDAVFLFCAVLILVYAATGGMFLG